MHHFDRASVKGPPLRCGSHHVGRPYGAALDPGSARQALASTIKPLDHRLRFIERAGFSSRFIRRSDNTLTKVIAWPTISMGSDTGVP